ncbi:MAG TPA: GGDEF domain-containing protein [Solirubrobacterales bacterium]|jgi:diguanylate cyclase (GGDEF)-like protein
MALGKRHSFFVLTPLAIVATAAAAALLDHALGSAVAAGLAFGITAEAGVSRGRRCGRAVALGFVAAIGIGLSLGHRHDALEQWAIYSVALTMVVEVVGARAARLHHSAITDPLTGLFDRKGLWEAAEQAKRRCRRDARPLTLVHIDLDEFKLVNDSFGHAEGDRLLRECADSWTPVIGPDDTLARMGGDEFLLVLPGSDRADAERLVERLRFRSPTGWSHGSARLRDDESLEDCLLRADAALYAAKDECRPRRRAAHGLRLTPELREVPPARRPSPRTSGRLALSTDC